ncbi:MAG: hypothetical protein KF836_06840 [Fimbriimonadaceae bacterium]|nr:hypothetical protein [Fimbriimonadaceae bacterium]
MKFSFFAAVGLIAFTLAGCVPPPAKSSGTTVPTTPEPPKIDSVFQTAESLKPEVAPPKEANIILTGTSIPVELKETRKENQVSYTWVVDPKSESGDPVEVETEKYFFNDSVFSFAGTAHEKYDPPIRLIQYPLEVGSTWEWTGNIITGQIKSPAKATISTSADTANWASGKVNTLLVKVTLEFAARTSPTARELKFWFKPGEGLIRRDLWDSSTRELRANPPGTPAPESPE